MLPLSANIISRPHSNVALITHFRMQILLQCFFIYSIYLYLTYILSLSFSISLSLWPYISGLVFCGLNFILPPTRRGHFSGYIGPAKSPIIFYRKCWDYWWSHTTAVQYFWYGTSHQESSSFICAQDKIKLPYFSRATQKRVEF